MNDWAGLAWLVVLLAFNAFFVASEFAVISARRSQIEPLADKGSRSAKTASSTANSPSASAAFSRRACARQRPAPSTSPSVGASSASVFFDSGKMS